LAGLISISFGVHRVPDVTLEQEEAEKAEGRVSIGVRRVPDAASSANSCQISGKSLHCLSAFTAFPGLPLISQISFAKANRFDLNA
jgi:hypothetical protein